MANGEPIMDVSTITLRMFLVHPLDIPLLQWGLFVLVIGVIGVLLYVQLCRDHLDLRWLILERPHKPSLSKIAQVVALVVSTWGFVVLVFRNNLTETYFIGYMVTWSGSAAYEAYINKGRSSERRRDDPEGLEERGPR
jgi:hypothetical protein